VAPPSLRVLLVTQDYPPPPGGIQTLTKNLKRGLERSGHEVELVYAPIDDFVPTLDELLPRRFALEATPGLLSRVWGYHNYVFRETTRVIDSFDPDVVHAIHVNGRGAIEAGVRNGVATTVSTHALELGHRQIATATIRHADAIHAVSEFTGSLVTDLVDTANPYVVHPSIAVSEYDAAGVRYETVPGKVTTMARFVDRKNIRTVIDGWGHVERAVDPVELVVIGEGPNRESLEELASDLESVRFTGWVDHDEKLRHLAESEAFVLVPRRSGYDVEGFGIVYIEAQAAGTPVIGSQRGGAPEAIGGGGVVVDDETDPTAVGAAMLDLLTDDGARHRYRETARERIAAFDLQRIGDRHVDRYRETMDQRRT
jgi:phosphatidylinositol alpha-1,6-mannosyltransferase